ncbi:alpha/beta fold hydrolase [Streptomyces sp. RPT161]|uniref:alpha/beta fold hydrolase n=1 Tax=Streptomyces sp. RPT161 TaxID=3015993 RepID=UPI0022B93003|nr:alpha/beta hydrolase [Streptomyces sp. RPT161]
MPREVLLHRIRDVRAIDLPELLDQTQHRAALRDRNRISAHANSTSLGSARQDRTSVPTTVLWPEHDPLFPRDWSDRLADFFSDVTLRLIDGVGHFAPVEYPDRFAAAIIEAVSG